MSHVSSPKTNAGGRSQVASSDSESQDLLRDILLELRKMNIYLSAVTDIQIENDDIGE